MNKNITYLFNGRRLGLERRRFSYSSCIPERRSIKDRRCNDQSKIIALKRMENSKATLVADFI